MIIQKINIQHNRIGLPLERFLERDVTHFKCISVFSNKELFKYNFTSGPTD